MIQVVYSREFLKSAQHLPKPQQLKLAHLIKILSANPYNHFLHTKHLSGKYAGFLSFRITRDWRVVFQFTDPAIIKLLRVVHRKDAYC
ncbi:MAG: hypothetical protein A3H64_03345 [Candidatus Ryanbacteria bacterium RIFCSPLOWO2_02_FULL_45_11c]|uniref:Toxin YoeB n=1 Tax=Candidatus Ryanbacteria bacterium RIFCSPLOWO2_02_FULL_45_11c TaxID=1802128 RepID=A0A1G2H4L7_9BACT|nr:MAG: hypothetical protein A3H64_03345 [Candidatus Ryanbacteria bacterium RIFCSPLOWO2_02_FULL_45_11c]